MIAYIVTPKMNDFMQAADMFAKNKFLFTKLDLKYIIDNKTVVSEESIMYLAKLEFKEKLIFLQGENEPLCINPAVQTISDGKGWTLLLDALKTLYPHRLFSTDEYMMNIKVKPIEAPHIDLTKFSYGQK